MFFCGIWAVAVGFVGGAILGGLTGWGVGTIMEVGLQMTCGFAQGAFKTAEKCLAYHFKKHGAEVGARTIQEVVGATANVFRYEVGNYYIHMVKSAKEIIIISFDLL